MEERNRVKKFIGASMVVLCMAFAIIFTTFCADASEGTSSVLYETRTYEKEDTVPSDIPTGYLFGGWYTAENEEAVVTSPEIGKTYLAKFVPEEVLGIKAQISDTLLKDSTAEKSAIRFVTSVDSIKYKKVGFLIKKGAGEVKETNVTNTVYESLYAVTNENGTVGEKITTAFPSIFHAASKYFKTYTIKNVPDSAYNTDITVTPYWITLDGTKVEGTKSIKTVNLGRSWIYVNTTANLDTEEYGTYHHPYTDLKQVLDVQEKGIVHLLSDVTINESLIVADTTDITVKSEGENLYTIAGDAVVENLFQVTEGAVLTVQGLKLSGGTNAITAAGTLHAENVEISGSSKGLELTGRSVATVAGLKIADTGSHGIYMKGADVRLTASDISISNTGNNAIEIDGTGSNKANFTATGEVTIDKTASGMKGLFLNGGKASADVKNLTIDHAGEHGIYINNANGRLTSTGMIKVTSPGKRGLHTRGTVQAVNMTIEDTGDNAIEIDGTGDTNKGNLTVTGRVTINRTASKMKGLNINGANASADVKNLAINYAGENGIYINSTTGRLASTGTIQVTNAGARGIYNNGGEIQAGNIVVADINNSYNAIENVGKITATGDVTVTRVKNAAAIRNKGTMTIDGTTTVSDISGTKSVNGIQQDGGKTMTVNDVIISGISQTASNPNSSGVCEHSNGIYNNKGTINLNGTITISNVKNPAAQTATETTEATGIVNFGTIQGTGSLNISDTGRDGIYNAVSSGSKGLIDLSGNITIDTVGKHGIHSKTGTINITGVAVKDTEDIGIFMEVGATLKADTVMVDGAKNQAVQLNHANTLTVGTMTLTNTPKNGLRLYNNNANPTVTIGTLITKNCGEHGLAAAKAITSTDLNITLLQYCNCGKNAVHENIQSGVEAREKLIEAGGQDTVESTAKVMSYNVFWNLTDSVAEGVTITNRAQKIANIIAANNPDILMLQEVSGSGTGWTSQLVPYAKAQGYGYYGYTHKGDRCIDSAVNKDTTNGNDELTPILWKTDKYDCEAKGHFWGSDTPDVPGSATWASIGVTCSYPRCINWVLLRDKVTDERIIVVNYHAAPDKDGVSYENVRNLTAELIVDKVTQLSREYTDAAIIMGGDWNMQRTHAAYKTITNNGYEDAKLGAATTTSRDTYNAWNRDVSKFGVGDFLFGDGGIWFAAYSVVDDLDPDGSGFYISDHSPIIADIKY